MHITVPNAVERNPLWDDHPIKKDIHLGNIKDVDELVDALDDEITRLGTIRRDADESRLYSELINWMDELPEP